MNTSDWRKQILVVGSSGHAKMSPGDMEDRPGFEFGDAHHIDVELIHGECTVATEGVRLLRRDFQPRARCLAKTRSRL